ncbi:MAG: hypothetical protein V3V06_06735 [Dehalococcoidia bacterium]
MLVAALVAAGCDLGGGGGFAELAYAVDEDDPDRPIIEPLTGVVIVGEQVLIRLEVPEPLDAPVVRVRLEKRVGTSFFQRAEFEIAVTPPWNVAVLPIRIPEPGHWNVALIANSRKITDVELDAERR